MSQRLAAFVFVTLLAPALAVAAEVEMPSYQDEIDEWHAGRIERLRKPTGWLSLVGLFPLPEGESRMGSDPDNDLVTPEGTPPYIASFLYRGGHVQLRSAPGVTLSQGEGSYLAGVLESDKNGEATMLSVGSLTFYLIERSEQLYVRVKDSNSPVLKHFEGIERFPVDEAWRIQARYERYDPPRDLAVPNILGTVSESKCHGAIVFEQGEKQVRLEPTGEPSRPLFLVFGDTSNGDDTYGAGRFLYVDPPLEDGTIVVDFNRSYNPPCVFTPYATCPLPPEGNKLPFRVEAGEKDFGAGH